MEHAIYIKLVQAQELYQSPLPTLPTILVNTKDQLCLPCIILKANLLMLFILCLKAIVNARD